MNKLTLLSFIFHLRLLELLQTIQKTFRPLFVRLSRRKELIKHVGVELIVAKMIYKCMT